MILDAPHEPLAEDENMVLNKDQLEQMAKSLEGRTGRLQDLLTMWGHGLLRN